MRSPPEEGNLFKGNTRSNALWLPPAVVLHWGVHAATRLQIRLELVRALRQEAEVSEAVAQEWQKQRVLECEHQHRHDLAALCLTTCDRRQVVGKGTAPPSFSRLTSQANTSADSRNGLSWPEFEIL